MEAQMTESLITRAQAALVGVTDRPWKQGVRQPAKVFFADGFTVANCFHDTASEYRDEANARFIAASRQLVPDLITQAIADKARIAELEEALKGMLQSTCGPTGFAEAVRHNSGLAYPWPSLDIAEAKARAALKGSTP